MTMDKVTLGQRLFFDEQLSFNQSYSCASCHKPELAYSDGLPLAIGSTGQRHFRNAMALVNVAYNRSYGWADHQIQHLEQQALVPLLNHTPIEMGMLGHEEVIINRLLQGGDYAQLFAAAFPGQDKTTVNHIQQALASFQRTLISGASAYDDWLFNDNNQALSAAAKRGMALFYSEQLQCQQCHRGINFSGDFAYQDGPGAEPVFVNNGLYLQYPPRRKGLFELTGDPSDKGKFKIPTLRNIALTAPYMHDGSLPDLQSVIDHYASGGQGHANQHPTIKGFTLQPQQSEDLKAFLRSLSDNQFISGP